MFWSSRISPSIWRCEAFNALPIQILAKLLDVVTFFNKLKRVLDNYLLKKIMTTFLIEVKCLAIFCGWYSAGVPER